MEKPSRASHWAPSATTKWTEDFATAGLGPRGDNDYGAYVLMLPPDERERARELTVRFRSKLSNQSRFFSVDATPLEAAELNEIAESCDVSLDVAKANGLESVLDASRNSYPRDVGR